MIFFGCVHLKALNTWNNYHFKKPLQVGGDNLKPVTCLKIKTMNIIRDEEMHGLMMIPLFQQWNIHRCNIKGCKEKPTTIITGTTAGMFGMCENHYQKGKDKGTMTLELEF